MGEPMRALSIMQPWLNCIAYSDKRVENRLWRAPDWIIGKRIALAASRQPDWHAPGMAWTAAGLTSYTPGAPRKAWTASLTLGAVLAVATVTGCHPLYHICNPRGPVTVCTKWSAWGQCHWLLGDVRPLADPVPCKGALGLWHLPEDAEKAVRAQLGEDGNHGEVR